MPARVCSSPSQYSLEKEVISVTKQPARTIEFGEKDETFISKLAKDIGCYYRRANERTYNLNKCNSDINSEMGVFAWVHKEDDDYFWVATRKVWVEEARTSALASGKATRLTCFPKYAQPGDSVCFDTRDGYQDAIRALRLINETR